MKNSNDFHSHLRNYFIYYLPVERKMSEQTIRTYKQAINCYRTFLKTSGIQFENVCFDHFSKEKIAAFLVWMRAERKASPSTINLRLTAIKSFLRYCGERDIALMHYYTQATSIHRVKKEQKATVDYLTEKQLKVLFKIPDIQTRLGRRNRFLMIFAYETGARIHEILGLKLSDIIETDGMVRIRIQGKGNKIRYVPLLIGVLNHLKAYCKEFHPLMKEDEYLFYTIHDGIKTQMKPGTIDAFLKQYAKIAISEDPQFPENLHEHMLRHSIAMAMYKKGIPLSYIRDFLGHSSVESTRIYAYADDETIRMSLEAVDGLIENNDIKSKRWKNSENSLLKYCGLT